MSNASDRIRRGCPDAPRLPKVSGAVVRPIAFLDRDGVVNADKGYVHSVEEFEWMPGVIAAIRLLNEKGFIVAVVTNQSGIGRGLYGEEEFMFLTFWMLDEIEKYGAHVDVVYYCPHHPESKDPEYQAVCPARKPGAGMLERAESEFLIDKTRSFLIGNRESDLGAASTFGIPGYLYEGGDLEAFVRKLVG